MEYIEVYESFNPIKWVNDKVDRIKISAICAKYGIENWEINSEGLVDVNGSVKIQNLKLNQIPIKFGRVTGKFLCNNNLLESLEGCPRFVGNKFNCSYNNLEKLDGCPDRVVGNFTCSENKLISLEGGPIEVGGTFDCCGNKILSLAGLTENIGRDFIIHRNPIAEIHKLFKNRKMFMDSLDWSYIKGDAIIVSRFEDACEEAGIKVPKFIDGYKYI